MWKTTGQIARDYGVSRTTILRWINDGKFTTRRTKGGHFRIWSRPDCETILYARVSSSKQKSSIETQRRILEEFTTGEFVQDIGSGFNFKRRGFVKILELAMSGTAIRLVATTQDRITRVGFPLVRKVIELHGGQVELVEERLPTENFDVATLVSFLTSFCNSQSGKRNASRHKED